MHSESGLDVVGLSARQQVKESDLAALQWSTWVFGGCQLGTEFWIYATD